MLSYLDLTLQAFAEDHPDMKSNDLIEVVRRATAYAPELALGEA